jgi:bifunctional DNA-binding transcriptional regulator/antitoxin component of YhaV-PrlF toxin-antitoxin module
MVRGQTVILAEIRRRFKLGPSKKLEWIVVHDGIKVVPVMADPIDAFRGRVKGGSVEQLLFRTANVIIANETITA